MRATVEPLEGNKVKLSVQVDASEFDKAVDAALRKIAREVRIPGFRPGKAPRRLLEARMGKQGVRQEAMREALPEYYAEALRQTEVDAIAPPEIDVTSGEEDGALAFDAVVLVRPQVSIVGYQGLRVSIPTPVVSDEEVQRQVDKLRQSFGELTETDRPAQDGDHVTITLNGSRDGEPVPGLSAEDYLYEVGSEAIVADVDAHLRGAKPGDVLEFDAPIPGGGGADGDDLVSFKILVKDVKEMVLPEVTDEWASEASEFETVHELEADLRRRLGSVKKMQATLALRQEAVKALAELVEIEVPEPLVTAEMERRLQDLAGRLEAQGATLSQYLEATGQDQGQLLGGLRQSAGEAVKADLALRALAEAEGFDATDEDLSTELAGLAERLEMEPEALRHQLEHGDQIPAVRSDIRKSKALAWLMANVEIVDDEGNPIDRADLEPEPEPESDLVPAGTTNVEDTE